MNAFIIWISKLVLLFARVFNFGYGSTWPGHIALSINPNFIKQALGSNKNLKIVLIAGTNGKTTTTKLLKFILEKNGLKAFQNEAGANLLNGVASSIIRYANFIGKLHYDVAIFEIDENTLPLMLQEVKPYAVVVLNLFRDQLDRYGEVNTIAKRWQNSLQNAPKHTLLFINGDDPQLSYIGEKSKLKTHYFGIDEKYMTRHEIPHDVDFLYCPKCRTRLVFEKMSYSHMGKFRCPKCGFKRERVESFSNLPNPLFGIYNIYNINAASLVAYNAFGVSLDTIKRDLQEFKPAFGRQEEFLYRGKKTLLLLSKNPTGFNQSIEAVNNSGKKYVVLLVLNDRIPDGRDVSWIWDVEFEELVKHANRITVSGDRCYDMGLRIMYSNPSKSPINFKIEENLQKAINNAAEEADLDETLFILPTYSAMLEVRKILTGKKIL